MFRGYLDNIWYQNPQKRIQKMTSPLVQTSYQKVCSFLINDKPFCTSCIEKHDACVGKTTARKQRLNSDRLEDVVQTALPPCE